MGYLFDFKMMLLSNFSLSHFQSINESITEECTFKGLFYVQFCT